MKLSSGYAYSLIRYGLPFSYPKLEKNISTDVVVLGGGISGALAAHYLVEQGVNCILIDARTIGLGSTCASTALLQYEIDVALHKLVQMIGERAAVRSYKSCEAAVLELERLARKIHATDFERKKSLYSAAYKKDLEFLKNEFEARKKYGFSVRWLDEKKINKEFGFNSYAGILSDVAAVTDSYMFTHRLLQYNLKRGLQVFDRTAADKITHDHNSVQVSTPDKFIIKAKKIVYATGYEVVDFISKPIVKLASTYAVASESFNSAQRFGRNDTIFWNTAKPYLYMRTTSDDRIILGGRDEEFFSHTKRDQLITTKTRQLRNDFKKMFPQIPFKPEFSWAGVFGSTKDGLPYIGEYKKMRNSYFALGFGGNGITFSQVAGEIIADLIKGKKNKDAALFSFDR